MKYAMHKCGGIGKDTLKIIDARSDDEAKYLVFKDEVDILVAEYADNDDDISTEDALDQLIEENKSSEECISLLNVDNGEKIL